MYFMVNVKDTQKFNKLTFIVVAKMLSWYNHTEYSSYSFVKRRITNKFVSGWEKKIPFHYKEETESLINSLLDKLMYK